MPTKQKSLLEKINLVPAAELREDSDNALLMEKIGNLHLDKENLILQTNVLNHTVKDLKAEQDATFNYMTLDSAEKGALLSSIQSQLENIQAEQKIAKIEYRDHIEMLTGKNALDEAKAGSIIEGLKMKLFSVSEYVADKSLKDDSMKDLKDTLAQERIAFTKEFESLHVRHLQEKEIMRKEYALDFSSMKDELSSQLHGRLPSKTKKAVMVNLFHSKQLYSQQNDVEITHKERERIKARERQLELELSLSENTREEILSKLQSTHRTIKQLHNMLEAERVRTEDKEDQIRLKNFEIFHMKINIQKLTEENSKQEKHTSKLNGIWQHLSRGIIKLNLLSNPARKTQAVLDKALLRLFISVVKNYPDKFRFLHKHIMNSSDSVILPPCSMISLILDGADEYDYTTADDRYDMTIKDDINVVHNDDDDDDDCDKSIVSMRESCKDDDSIHIDNYDHNNDIKYDINNADTYKNSENLIDAFKNYEYDNSNDIDCDHLSTTISNGITTAISGIFTDDFDDDLSGSSLPALLSTPLSPTNFKKILSVRSDVKTKNILLKKIESNILCENKIDQANSPSSLILKPPRQILIKDGRNKNKMKLADYKEMKLNNLNTLADKNKINNEMENIFINGHGSIKVNKNIYGNNKNKNINSGMYGAKSPKEESINVHKNIKNDDNHERNSTKVESDVGNIKSNGNEIEEIGHNLDLSTECQPNTIILHSLESSKLINPTSITLVSTEKNRETIELPTSSKKIINFEVEMEDYDDDEKIDKTENDDKNCILDQIFDDFEESNNPCGEESKVPAVAVFSLLDKAGNISSDYIDNEDCLEIKECEEGVKEENINPDPDIHDDKDPDENYLSSSRLRLFGPKSPSSSSFPSSPSPSSSSLSSPLLSQKTFQPPPKFPSRSKMQSKLTNQSPSPKKLSKIRNMKNVVTISSTNLGVGNDTSSSSVLVP